MYAKGTPIEVELTGDVVSISLADKEGYKITIEKLKENL